MVNNHSLGKTFDVRALGFLRRQASKLNLCHAIQRNVTHKLIVVVLRCDTACWRRLGNRVCICQRVCICRCDVFIFSGATATNQSCQCNYDNQKTSSHFKTPFARSITGGTSSSFKPCPVTEVRRRLLENKL